MLRVSTLYERMGTGITYKYVKSSLYATPSRIRDSEEKNCMNIKVCFVSFFACRLPAQAYAQVNGGVLDVTTSEAYREWYHLAKTTAR